MSEESGNGRGAFFLFYIVVPSLYVLLRLLPYLCFYVLPFAVASLLIGGAWVLGCQAGFTEYKRVAIFFPVTVFLIVMTVDFPSRIPEPLRKKNYVESPVLYNAFNDMKSGIEGFVNWTWASHFRFIFGSPIIPPAKYEAFIYDRSDLSWVLWLSLCLGAPAFFLYQAKKDDDGKIADLRALFDAKVKTEQGKASEYLNDYLREKNWAKHMLEEKDKEIVKLKAVAQFAKPAELPGASAEIASGAAVAKGEKPDPDDSGSKGPNGSGSVFDIL